MNKKSTILAFVPYYLPGYKSGGPTRSIANLVEQLGDNLDFRIVTTDRDFLDTEPYRNVVIDEWNHVGKATVFYTSPQNRSLKNITRLIQETQYNALYLNSFFNRTFTIYPLLARRMRRIPERPVILAPRGEFAPGALALGYLKKRAYIACAKMTGICSNITWQASGEHEAADIRRELGATAGRIIVAPVFPSVTTNPENRTSFAGRASGNPLRICFLSRISRMKNLDYALRVLAGVSIPVEFDIYGTTEDICYWHECLHLMKKLPGNVTICYRGVIDHAQIPPVFAGYDLLFLPTRGESFGHVIHEALSAGLPVLISDQTPWRNLTSLGVGWDLPLNSPEEFRAAIESMANMDDITRTTRRQTAKHYAKRIASNEQILAANMSLFHGTAMDMRILEYSPENIYNPKTTPRIS